VWRHCARWKLHQSEPMMAVAECPFGALTSRDPYAPGLRWRPERGPQFFTIGLGDGQRRKIRKFGDYGHEGGPGCELGLHVRSQNACFPTNHARQNGLNAIFQVTDPLVITAPTDIAHRASARMALPNFEIGEEHRDFPRGNCPAGKALCVSLLCPRDDLFQPVGKDMLFCYASRIAEDAPSRRLWITSHRNFQKGGRDSWC
jgi:hypothetical protein